jgi:hypothetical protein
LTCNVFARNISWENILTRDFLLGNTLIENILPIFWHEVLLGEIFSPDIYLARNILAENILSRNILVGNMFLWRYFE